MADAMCGPSNPLQQFKQQTQHDRTLQQDRLTSRHTPVQGFRSADPNAGLLDPEFEAFQAGLPPSELSDFSGQRLPPLSAVNFAGPSQTPSWANDFQRMQISPPPPFQAQQQYTPQSNGGGNWAQGFREHVSQTTPRSQQAAPSPQAFQHMARYGMNSYQNNFAQPNYAQPMLQSKGKQAVTEQFDEAAFERAFDQARDALQAEQVPQTDFGMDDESAYVNGASTGNMDMGYAPAETLIGQVEEATKLQQSLSDAERESILAHAARLDNLQRLESDSVATEMLREDSIITEEQQREDIKPPNDDDALAATAHELLQKVEHNQSDKFRNSQFLNLMRRLRDREVKVEGDNMVETTAASTSHTTTKSVHFDNSEQTPQPLQQPINAAPLDYGQTIPPNEQDHDAMRHINPHDGQEVVDLLNEPTGTEEISAAATHDIDSGPYDPEPAESPYNFMRFRPWTHAGPPAGSA